MGDWLQVKSTMGIAKNEYHSMNQHLLINYKYINKIRES